MSELSSSPGADVKLTRVFSRTPSSWDPQDDLLLRHLKEQQKLGWKEIASHFAHRTPNACQFRWRRLRSGSLKNSTNSPTPTSGANTPATSISTSATVTNNNGADPSSNSASPSAPPPPPLAKQEPNVSQHLVTKFSSLPSKKSTSPKLKDSKKTQPINVPVYNQWTFHTSTLSSNMSSSKNTPTFKDSPDPLSSSLNFSNSESDSEEDKFNSSAVLIETSLSSGRRPEVLAEEKWTPEEDELLLTRRKRALSFAELSILLPSRTEPQIWSRIDELDKKTVVKTTAKTKRSNSSRSHSHPHPIHTPSHAKPPSSSTFTRSYSSSSQTSISSSNPILSSSMNSTSNFFLSQDSTRSKSFSYITPYSQSTDRYNLRKNSITAQESRTRSNSFLQQPKEQHQLSEKREGSTSSELEDEEALKIEPKLPHLETIFNDFYTR